VVSISGIVGALGRGLNYHFWIEEAIKEAKEGKKPIILFSRNYGINIEDCAVTLSSDLFLA